MKSNLFPIAKEGWRYIAYSALAYLIFSILGIGFGQIISFVLFFVFVALYRNPEREMPSFEEFSVLSPVDGVVISIEELDDQEYAYKIEIDSTYFNTAILRAPMSATIQKIAIKRGAKLPKENPLFEKLNEQCEMIFEDKNLNKLKLIHRLKQGFDALNIYAAPLQNIAQGRRYGVMVNGVTTLCLAQNFRLSINVGSELVASETLIGYFSKK